ncbi:MAG: rapA 1 [Myxococcaceae bacterium]|nr:rapA 1 [Myxococcaceae bacterium]
MSAVIDTPERETERLFTGLSRGRFGRIAPERIARHVIAVTGPSADWALRKAALDALARRYGFAQRNELRMVGGPARGALGVYQTKTPPNKARAELRPYETALLELEPLRMSCACADFVRSSLGLCKHGLVVLEALEESGRLVAAAVQTPAAPERPTLRWSYDHPLRGSADRLARLHYLGTGDPAAPSGLLDGKPSEHALHDAVARVALIRELEQLIQSGAIATEPAVPTLLREERARAERRVEIEPRVQPCMDTLKSLRRTLYPYQRAGVQRFMEAGRLLLADDMGLGKTTQAIAVCHGLFATEGIQRGLLIVPAALKAQWKREWQATTDVPLSLVEGSPSERARLYKTTARGFLLIGYEQLLRDLTLVQGFTPELVVLDEAQRIKNWATKSAAYVKSLAPAYRLVLTGTPMENRLDELASIMDFVDDLALEPKWRLVALHTLTQDDTGKGIVGAQNLDVLRERLAGSMLRRVRKEVLAQLPSRTDTRVPVELTDVQREHHDDLRKPIGELAAKAARRALSPPEFLQLMQLLMKQRMICNGMAQLQFETSWPRCQNARATPDMLSTLFSPKLAVLRGLIESVVVNQKRKAVVFSQWRNMLRLSEWAVRDLLEAHGLRALFFTGAESGKQREQALVEFHEAPEASVLFLSDAGGVGLNLQRAASCCINLELPWNPAVLEQRIGRIHRLGQALPIDVYNLVAEEGIEGRIATLLAHKSALFSSLFDGTSDEVRFDGDGSFLAGVQKLVEPLPSALASTLDEARQETREEPLEPPVEAATELPELSHAQTSALGAGVPTRPELSRARFPDGLQVTRLEGGGLRVEAAPALAGALSELLETLARSLRT